MDDQASQWTIFSSIIQEKYLKISCFFYSFRFFTPSMGGRKTITSQARTTQLMIMQNTSQQQPTISRVETSENPTLDLKLDKGTHT